jgi:hypothetical protein
MATTTATRCIALQQAGSRVIRIWEHEQIDDAADDIQRAVQL